MGKLRTGFAPRKYLRHVALAGAFAGIATPLFAQDSYNNTSLWNGTSFISSWGSPNTSTYGQTFKADGAPAVLGSFTFYLSQQTGTPPQYQALVYEWNQASQRIVGPALFTSAVATAPATAAGVYSQVTVATGGVALVPGKTYVMFLSLSNIPGGTQPNTTYRYGAITNNASFPNGQFVFFNNGTNFSQLLNGTWSTIAQDLAMVLNFGPTSMAAPLFSAGLNTITLDAMRDVNRVVQARLDGETGLSAGDAFQGNRDAWMKPYGAFTQQGEREGHTGYHARTHGIAFGVDRRLSQISRVGVAAALGQVQANALAPTNQNATIQTYTLIGYGRHSIDEQTDLTWQVDGGVTDNRGTRKLDFIGGGNTATSRYYALTGHIGAALSRSYAYGANTTISPALRADYAVIRSNGYTEQNGGVLGLSVANNVAQELIIGADARVAHKLDSKSTLTANLGLGFDVLNERNNVTAAYLVGSENVRFYGMRRSPVMLRGGVGLNLHRVGKTQVALRYDVELRESFINQTASVNVRVPF